MTAQEVALERLKILEEVLSKTPSLEQPLPEVPILKQILQERQGLLSRLPTPPQNPAEDTELAALIAQAKEITHEILNRDQKVIQELEINRNKVGRLIHQLAPQKKRSPTRLVSRIA